MRTDRPGVISLVLSAITLAIVLSIAVRSAPSSVDPGPVLGGIRSDLSSMQADIADLRTIAERPTASDPGPALGRLRSDMSAMRADIAELRAIAERPTASANVDQLSGIQARLDSLDSAVGGIATKFTALCNAVNASPISPPGGAC